MTDFATLFSTGSPIKSIQRGTLSLTSDVGATTSNTATISAVTTSKSVVIAHGSAFPNGSSADVQPIKIGLTNSTTLTATHNGYGGTILWQVVEYN